VKIERGSVVSLDYDILLDSGEQVDSSALNGPLRLRVGQWRALPGLGEKLIGLHLGDERLIRLNPAEAFGDWDPDAVLTMRQSRAVGDVPVQDGATLRVETRDGASAVCRAYVLTENRLALDFNHPLAGQPVTLFVRVKAVADPPVPSGGSRRIGRGRQDGPSAAGGVDAIRQVTERRIDTA
jgi:FKBP-type peptidyl-prolyl cis-trans isomerase 2